MVKNKSFKKKESQTHTRIYLSDKKMFDRICKRLKISSSEGFRKLLRRKRRR